MFARPLFPSSLRLLFTLLLGGVLLSSCDREAINAREQSGVWDIQRVTATSYDTLGTVLSTVAATDAGQVAFINITGQSGSDNDEARFYLDKVVPSRLLSSLMGNNGSSVTGTIVTEWLVDQHERRRITLRPFTDNPFLALTTFIFTITDETSDTQRWQFIIGDPNGDHVMFREEWEVKRVQ
jgi:hypothetical protein